MVSGRKVLMELEAAGVVCHLHVSLIWDVWHSMVKSATNILIVVACIH